MRSNTPFTPIPLPYKQEKKLLEMARYYFSEYTDFTIANTNQMCNIFFCKGTQEFLMPWFEFFTVYIVHHFVERNPEYSYARGIVLLTASLSFQNNSHPVDFIYQNYLLCKNK